MDFRKQAVSVQQAKETDLVDYLYELGYQPARIKASSYWYHSPLRTEKTPSSSANDQIKASEQKTLVVALAKTTLPKSKNLLIQLSERSGARHIDVPLKSRHLLKINAISPNTNLQ
ncbi:DUF4138 domain-containing protein [Dyadobacter sp. MSC1_007]|jgi:hypothetical protein|uniref:DUF4138 domain-containing protein n=1 Tax=Dyadobacter sp. MSC1_007 TaxID=2909264 RepID=UPI00202E2EB3|nr:DUF4138 domain-containing protein [Dyadobacter sp. MSC1_007]